MLRNIPTGVELGKNGDSVKVEEPEDFFDLVGDLYEDFINVVDNEKKRYNYWQKFNFNNFKHFSDKEKSIDNLSNYIKSINCKYLKQLHDIVKSGVISKSFEKSVQMYKSGMNDLQKWQFDVSKMERKNFNILAKRASVFEKSKKEFGGLGETKEFKEFFEIYLRNFVEKFGVFPKLVFHHDVDLNLTKNVDYLDYIPCSTIVETMISKYGRDSINVLFACIWGAYQTEMKAKGVKPQDVFAQIASEEEGLIELLPNVKEFFDFSLELKSKGCQIENNILSANFKILLYPLIKNRIDETFDYGSGKGEKIDKINGILPYNFRSEKKAVGLTEAIIKDPFAIHVMADDSMSVLAEKLGSQLLLFSREADEIKPEGYKLKKALENKGIPHGAINMQDGYKQVVEILDVYDALRKEYQTK